MSRGPRASTGWHLVPALLLALVAAPAAATGAGPATPDPSPAQLDTRSGTAIYESFRDGLADPSCPADASKRWKSHFAHAPEQLASDPDESLALFGYVVDAVRAAHLPTEYALIPFVESGYRADARSPSGTLGLWQMIKITARNHEVPIRAGYDGRLSPVDSTRAAVRYLKTLHGMFAGDWRLAVMAYNTGEFRMLGVLRRNGQNARDVDLDELQGLPGITRAYVSKIRALTCVLLDAGEADAWQAAMEHPVPHLQVVELPGDVKRVRDWAARHEQDPATLRRLNPVHVDGRIARPEGQPARLLAAGLADSDDAGRDDDRRPARGASGGSH